MNECLESPRRRRYHERVNCRLALLIVMAVGSVGFAEIRADRPWAMSDQPPVVREGRLVANSVKSVDNLQPGRWYEVPDSKLSAVIPHPPPVGDTGRTSSIIDAWSSGAYDTKRDRLIVWGGGHADYAGNEIYVFDVNALKWSRAWGPSADIPIPTCAETYPDGNPSSRHTYGGLQYIPTIDRFWAQGGSKWRCGSGTLATWTFDFDSSRWSRKKDAPGGLMLGVSSAFDPVTGHVFHQGGVKFSEYDPMADAWAVRGDIGASLSEDRVRNAAIDPGNRLFVAMGDGDFYVWDMKSWQVKRPATTGGAAMLSARAPGLAYDPVIKKLVGWPGGTAVYSLDVSTWKWTRHDAAPTNTVTPSPPTHTGTYGRFQYIPSKDAFIVVNGVNQNVFIYKLSPGTSTPSS